jgi:CRP-like cAMP-binding protein
MQSLEMGPGWMSRLVEVLQPASMRADRLASTALFAGLAWPDLEFAAGILTETLVERGVRMTVQGRPTSRLWLILEGEALVSADARPIRVAVPGDLVGLPSMFYATHSHETTIALSSIRAFEAGSSEFRQLVKHRTIRQRLAAAAKRQRVPTVG